MNSFTLGTNPEIFRRQNGCLVAFTQFHHTYNPNRVSLKCSKLYGYAKNRTADTTKFKEGHHKALLPQRLCIRKKGRKEDDLEADPQ